MKTVYKTDSFGCTFSTRKKFTQQLQAMIDKYAGEGWLLHSYQVVLGELCVVVFYRDLLRKVK